MTPNHCFALIKLTRMKSLFSLAVATAEKYDADITKKIVVGHDLSKSKIYIYSRVI